MEWKKILDKFYANPDNKVTKELLPSLVAQLWKKLNPGHVVTGFRKSGLHPPDRRAIAGKIMPDPLDLSNPGAGRGYALAKTQTEQKLVDAITAVIQSATRGPSNDQPGPSGEPPKRRARVQMKSGEVLTTDEAAARVEAEERAKSEKQLAKAE